MIVELYIFAKNTCIFSFRYTVSVTDRVLANECEYLEIFNVYVLFSLFKSVFVVLV